MIFVAGIAIAVFIVFLLFSKKDKSFTDKIFIAWMGVIICNLFLFYLLYSEKIYEYPYLLGIDFPIPMMHGILLYFYVGAATRQLPKKKPVLLLHFLPILAVYAYLLHFFVLPSDQKITVFKNDGAGYEVFLEVLSIAISLSGIIYITWSALLLKKYKRSVEEKFPNTNKIDLKWLQQLTWGLGAIWVVVVFSEGASVIFSTVVVFVFIVGFNGIRQKRIFTADDMIVAEGPKAKTEAPERKKYAKSGLDTEASMILYEELKQLMLNQHVYKNRDLSIGDLATLLEVHPNHLSQVINANDSKNFYDFVNAYRVSEFKRLVQDPENKNMTLLALANDCGFNSKSSFNRYFKKNTGQTPSQYFASVHNN